eukprot:TRINITY_DN5555_c0_g1_i1.p1 TRINITY_DN5555_c0_g1~~TRINITY_DN5555_c0_g1_i1.p1  ORF type:complete len:237 (+),score=49.80 TRINITY_DN5555_c0_g1_i1:90-713(+)
MADDEAIVALLNETFMYKVPPLRSADGYKAADWNGQHFMTGVTVVVEKGPSTYLRLKDKDGNPMVECLVTEKTVIPTSDSSRYFVLALKDPKGHTRFVGIGFTRESNLAPDFLDAINNSTRRERQLKELEREQNGWEDLSLKEGEVIKVQVTSKDSTKIASNPFGAGGLPSPPSAGKRRGRKQKATTKPTTAPATSETEATSGWVQF